jgi:hypothetical protein
MNFRSNGGSVKITFRQIAFGQTVFGQMVFQSNGLSVKWCSIKRRSVKWCFGQKTFGEIFSVKLFFGKVIQNFGKLKFFKVFLRNLEKLLPEVQSF